jgi:hypothetical protein
LYESAESAMNIKTVVSQSAGSWNTQRVNRMMDLCGSIAPARGQGGVAPGHTLSARWVHRDQHGRPG